METQTLPLASERAVYQAMFEYLDGTVRPRDLGELTLDTTTGSLRFIDSVCFAAPDEELIGAELAGWLVESERASAVVTRWRRGARAVLVKAPASVLLSGFSRRMCVEGTNAADGHVTHEGRLVLIHGSDRPPSKVDFPLSVRPVLAEAVAPALEAPRDKSDSEPEVILEDPAEDEAEAPSSAASPLRSEVEALLTDDASDLAPWSQPPPLASYTAAAGSLQGDDFELPPLGAPPSFAMFGGDLDELTSDEELYEMETRPRGEPEPARRAGGS
jgi:hypothetical protein